MTRLAAGSLPSSSESEAASENDAEEADRFLLLGGTVTRGRPRRRRSSCCSCCRRRRPLGPVLGPVKGAQGGAGAWKPASVKAASTPIGRMGHEAESGEDRLVKEPHLDHPGGDQVGHAVPDDAAGGQARDPRRHAGQSGGVDRP